MNPKQYQAFSFCCVIELEYSFNVIEFSIFKLIMVAKPTLSFQSKKGNEISIDDVRMGSYVSYLYDKGWYDGINEEVSVEENHVLVKFLHPIDPSVYLHWPAIDVKCWVPVNHEIQLLSIPTVNT